MSFWTSSGLAQPTVGILFACGWLAGGGLARRRKVCTAKGQQGYAVAGIKRMRVVCCERLAPWWDRFCVWNSDAGRLAAWGTGARADKRLLKPGRGRVRCPWNSGLGGHAALGTQTHGAICL